MRWIATTVFGVFLSTGCVTIRTTVPEGYEWAPQPDYSRAGWEVITAHGPLPGESHEHHLARVNWLHRVREEQAWYNGMAYCQPDRCGGELR